MRHLAVLSPGIQAVVDDEPRQMGECRIGGGNRCAIGSWLRQQHASGLHRHFLGKRYFMPLHKFAPPRSDLLVNVDLFRSDYSNLQVEQRRFDPVVDGPLAEVGNAAKSRSQGIELEGQWIATQDWRFKANVTYLDAYYVSYPGAPPST